jgi:hypothetical protein
MIDATIAMPVYKSKDIAFLAIESLCNQKTSIGWELIIAEEIHSQQLGVDFFQGYAERLKKAGCESIKYLEYQNWIPLPKKWKDIGKNADVDSKVFLLQAVDCYSAANRIEEAFNCIVNRNFDWLDYQNGFFYNLVTGQMIQYSAQSRTNLDMAFKTKYARTIPDSALRKGIDGFLFNHVSIQAKIVKKLSISKPAKLDSLDTDGQNNISLKRMSFYDNIRHPFIRTEITLEQLDIPLSIKDKLLNFRTK